MNLPTKSLKELMTSWRHDLHANPELGFEEIMTSRIVSKLLKDFGLKVFDSFGFEGLGG